MISFFQFSSSLSEANDNTQHSITECITTINIIRFHQTQFKIYISNPFLKDIYEGNSFNAPNLKNSFQTV